MTRLLGIAALCAALLAVAPARADDKPAAEQRPPSPTSAQDPRQGIKTRSTVQVVEGNAPVDDVISRLRRDRTAKTDDKGNGPTSRAVAPGSGSVPASPALTPVSPSGKEARELRRERLRLDDDGDVDARERRVVDGDRREDRKELRERLKQRRRETLEDRRDSTRR